jgi:hypothetical protein
MVIAAALTSDLHWEQMDMFRRHVLRRRGRGTAAGSRRSRPGVVLCSWQDQATRGGRGDDPGAGWGSGPFSGKRVPAAACTEAVSGAHQLLTWGKQEAAAAEANQLARQLDLHTFALRSIRGLLLSLTHRACPLARETDRGPPLGRRRNLGSRQFLMYVHIWSVDAGSVVVLLCASDMEYTPTGCWDQPPCTIITLLYTYQLTASSYHYSSVEVAG